MTRGQFILIRAGAAFAGLMVTPIQVLMFTAANTGIPVLLPAGVGVTLAVLGWFLPPQVVHSKAEDRRREMRYALVSYLTLVALHRAAGQGMAAALELSARSSPAWTFRRIGARIDGALRAGIPPWDGLAGLATDIGIQELSDLASIADTAGTTGAGIYSTLLAKARALRHALLADQEKTASIMSARMVLPKALLGIVTLLFLLYPAVSLIGAT
jgi:Flp pilus assembly protein TadB